MDEALRVVRPLPGRARSCSDPDGGPPTSAADRDYERLFSLTSTPTLEVAGDGRIVAANNAVVRLVRRDPDQLIGTRVTELFGDRAAALLRSDAPLDVVTQLPEGPTALRLLSTERERSGDGTPHRIVQAIRREGRATQDAERHEPTAGLSLVDDISHNLGTPLAIVAGYAETLAERLGQLSADEIAAAHGAIQRHAQRAVDELRGIQARVRAYDGGTGTVPSNILIAWLRRMLAGPLAATGSVLVEGRMPAHVTVDAAVARQALLSVCQALLGAERPATAVVVDATVSTDGTTFVVTGDEVVGLRDDHLAMLTVTRSLVQDAGGAYDLEAGEKVHRVRLPTRGSHSGPGSQTRIPIAVVEDDPDAAAMIRASLRAMGGVFQVVADERSLRSGLTAVAETRPRVLLLDHILPAGRGRRVLDEIHELSPRTTVVVLSTRAPRDAEVVDPEVVWLEKGRVMADLGAELLRIIAES